MLLSKYAMVTWNGANKKRYVEKGYTFTFMGDKFPVKIEDLSNGCCAMVHCRCDVCHKEFDIEFYKVSRQIRNGKKFSCGKKCGNKIGQETNLNIYGQRKPMQCQQFKDKASATYKSHFDKEINPEGYAAHQEKIKNTSRKKYGCDYPWQNPEVKAKFENTMIQRYGTINPMEVEDFKKKLSDTKKNFSDEKKAKIQELRKKTCLDKYGVENVMLCPEIVAKHSESLKELYKEHPEIMDKIRQTLFNNYGVEYVMQSDELCEKILQTKKANGTDIVSSYQLQLAQLLNGEVNHILNRYLLDIVTERNNIQYDIEYDGGGHIYYASLNDSSDKERNQYVIERSFKVIRYVTSKDKLFQDDILLDLFNYCYTYLELPYHNLVYIDVDNLNIHDESNILEHLTEEGKIIRRQ